MRSLRLMPLVTLALSVCLLWSQSTFAVPAKAKGIDRALLAKAKAGDVRAEYRVGLAYNFGDDVPRDYLKAAFWYRKGVEKGDPDSEFMLGGLYHFGQGVKEDQALAFNWIMKAAVQGHGDAEYFIAISYSEGWGVPKNIAQEIVWFRKGAEQGNINSQHYLGMAYATGTGIHRELSEAYFWLSLAAAGTDAGGEQQDIVENRDWAGRQLSQEELSSVRARLQKWSETHQQEQ